jgi:colicin import membrane protein
VARIRIRLSPDGTIVGKEWLQKSGVPAYDEAVMRAIDKTGVLPRDIDGRVPSPMDLEFKPHE